MLKTWEKLEETITKVGYRKIISKKFKMPDELEHTYDIAHDGETVSALVVIKDKKFVIAKQYRPGPEEILFEMPSGFVDEGETPGEAMKRELLEETGYTGELKYLGKTYRSAYSNGVKYFYVVLNAIKIAEPQNEEHEYIDTELISQQKLEEIVEKGMLTDLDCVLIALNFLKKQGIIS